MRTCHLRSRFRLPNFAITPLVSQVEGRSLGADTQSSCFTFRFLGATYREKLIQPQLALREMTC